jgi:hypothetical protein
MITLEPWKLEGCGVEFLHQEVNGRVKRLNNE